MWEQVCIDTVSYFSPGRSRTDAEISAASGQSFSTNSRGPHRDLLKPRKDFFTGGSKKKQNSLTYTPEEVTCSHGSAAKVLLI